MLAEKLLEGYNGFYSNVSSIEISDPIAYLNEACTEACIALEEAAQQYYTADIIGQSQILMESCNSNIEALTESINGKVKQLWIKFKEKVKEIIGKIISKLMNVINWVKTKFGKKSSGTDKAEILKENIKNFEKKKSSQSTRPDDRSTNSKSPSAQKSTTSKKSEIQVLLTDQSSMVLELPMKDLDSIPVPNIVEKYTELVHDVNVTFDVVSELANQEITKVNYYISKLGSSNQTSDDIEKDLSLDDHSLKTFEDIFEDMSGMPKRFKGMTPQGVLGKIHKEFDNIVRNAYVTYMTPSQLSSEISNVKLDIIADFLISCENIIEKFKNAQNQIDRVRPEAPDKFVSKFISIIMMHISCGISAANFNTTLINKRTELYNRAIGVLDDVWGNYCRGQIPNHIDISELL